MKFSALNYVPCLNPLAIYSQLYIAYTCVPSFLLSKIITDVLSCSAETKEKKVVGSFFVPYIIFAPNGIGSNEILQYIGIIKSLEYAA